MERFTAVAMCPACGMVDIHSLRLPKQPPSYTDDPLGVAQRHIDSMMHMLTWYVSIEPYGAEVIRECKCGKIWGQV